MFRHMRTLALAAAAASSLLGSAPARAAFPEQPITLIVPWAAGGGTDAIARMIGSMLEKEMSLEEIPIDFDTLAAAGSMATRRPARKPVTTVRPSEPRK